MAANAKSVSHKLELVGLGLVIISQVLLLMSGLNGVWLVLVLLVLGGAMSRLVLLLARQHKPEAGAA